MIPLNIEKEHIIKAIGEIDSNGVPSGRQSIKFCIRFEEKQYSPKYVLSLANKFANGEELDPSSFNGGQETNNFLKRLEFDIVEISSSRATSKSISPHKDTIGETQKRHDKNLVEKMAKIIDGNVESKIKIEQSIDRENHKESQKKDLNGWVATVIIQSSCDIGHSNDDRMNALSEIVNHIAKETSGDGVILFPCGWFYTVGEEPSTIYDWSEKKIIGILEEIDEHIIVCAGIDGMVDKDDYSHDQIAIAVSKDGIDAMGRKFHPSSQEDGHVELAKDYLHEEDGKSRVFELNGVKYFMCVCYDSYGVRHKNLPNPNVDVVLNLVHCFYPRGKGPSGDPYFARHGFAGAAKQWDCPVFGAAVFFDRNIPERWPSGVYWNQGDKSTQKWRYEDNPVKSQNEFKVNIKEGIALVKIYDLEMI